jgi:hypothetical protein
MAIDDTITIAGLTGTATVDAASLTIGGTDASKFSVSSAPSKGAWTQSSGTLVLTANTNVNANTNIVFTVDLLEPTSNQGAVSPTIATHFAAGVGKIINIDVTDATAGTIIDMKAPKLKSGKMIDISAALLDSGTILDLTDNRALTSGKLLHMKTASDAATNPILIELPNMDDDIGIILNVPKVTSGTGLLIDSTDVYSNGGVVGNSMAWTGTLLRLKGTSQSSGTFLYIDASDLEDGKAIRVRSNTKLKSGALLDLSTSTK